MSIDIFISAVSDEFGLYREFLNGQLTRQNVAVKVQEDFIPAGTPTVDKLDDYIRKCAAVIHLVGDMTGSWAKAQSLHTFCERYSDLSSRLTPLASSLNSGNPPLSYTQCEAYLAVYHNKPLVIAVPEPGAERDKKYRFETEQQASQQAHLQRLHALDCHVEIKFKDKNQLGLQVFKSSILDLLADASWNPLIVACTKILEAARVLREGSNQRRLANSQRKLDMAPLFEKVSLCLSTVAGDVDNGKFPYENCGEIYGYASDLPNMVKEVLGDDRARDLGDTLMSVYNGKQRLEGLKHLQDVSSSAVSSAMKDDYVKKTKEASGEFKALANAMRAG
jgi:hypothetical protein